MSPIKDITQLGRLVAGHHGWAAAKAFKSYDMNDGDRAALSQCAVELLKLWPQGSCDSATMSAALAVSLERRMTAPIHVVAGTLTLEGTPLFGDRQPFDGAAAFGTFPPQWDGHVWVMIGGYVVDISIFRAAYSAQGPARLARHIDLTFGPGKALYVDQWKRTRHVGLAYEPQYVLRAEEVTNLMGAAYRLIKPASQPPSA